MLFHLFKKNIGLLIFCLAVLSLNSIAQISNTAETITMEQGLPSDVVYSSTEDAQGYLWVGTNKGLCRYNGKIWQVYNANNSLLGNYITNVISDKNSGLWVTIENEKLCFFNTREMKAYFFEGTQKVPNLDVKKNNKNNGVFVTINNEIVSLIFNFNLKKIESKSEFILLDNTPLILDNNNKWIGLTLKEPIKNNENNILYKKVNSNWIKNINTISGNFLVANNTVYYIDEKEAKQITVEPIFKNGKTKMFATNTNELLYIATANEGIAEIDTFGNLTHYGKDDGLTNLAINQIYLTSNGSIYVATIGGGIQILNATRRKKYSIKKGPTRNICFNNPIAYSLAQSQLITLNLENYKKEEYELNYYPTSLLVDNNKVYIGNTNSLNIYNLAGNKLILQQTIISNIIIKSIKKWNNKIWLATEGKGIAFLEDNKIKYIDSKIPFYNIEKLFVLKKGLAAISYENGFFTYDNNKRVQHYTKDIGLLSNSVYTLYENANNLWIGCKGGISKFVNNKWVQNITSKQGFNDDRVLELGYQYNLLFLIISEKSVQQLLDGKIVPLTNNNYKDKLYYQTSAAFVDTSISEILIGDKEGITILNIEEFQPNPYVLPPNLMSIQINGIDADTTKDIKLKYNFNSLEFKLAPQTALLFNSTQFYYKLNNESWISINDTLSITFKNLRPGTYNLYAKSVNSFGIESEIIFIKKIIVNRPWWLQWWFIALMGLLLALIIYGILKFITKQKLEKQLQEIKLQQQLENERHRISRDLHDNMGAYTSALIANVQSAKQKEIANEDIDKMQTNAESILSSLRDTIWVLNNKSILVSEMNDQFKNYMFKILKNFEQLQFDAVENIEIDFVLNANAALHFNKILQEIIQNIIKHSKASIIDYSIICKDDLQCMIKDNGVGFQMDPKILGNGINNITWRAKEANIDLKIESKIGFGTTFYLNYTPNEIKTSN